MNESTRDTTPSTSDVDVEAIGRLHAVHGQLCAGLARLVIGEDKIIKRIISQLQKP